MGGRRDKTAYATEARRRIRESFNALPIFQRPRSKALYHYCAVLEVEALKAGADKIAFFGAHRRAVESSIHAIPALFERCSPDKAEQLNIEQQVFFEARELYDFSRKYEQVEFSYELADRGQFEIHVAALDPRITFAYASADSDAADTLLRSGELWERIGRRPAPADLELTLAPIAAVRGCLEKGINFSGPDSIAYQHTTDLVSYMADWARNLATLLPCEFPADLMIGSLSFGDLRRFWAAALVTSNSHDMAHLIAMGGDVGKWPIGSIVNLRPTDEWARILSDVSGLSLPVTSEILSWYTFDPAISSMMPPVQPFLEMVSDRLGSPSLFLIGSDFERNVLKLLNRHPRLRQYVDAVNSAKEPLALAQLTTLFPEPAFKTATRVCLPGVTDVDLAIYEWVSGFALLVQHKWLIAPDTANESAANDEELGKGVRQALKARAYCRENPARLQQALSLPRSSPLSSIEAVVLCRGAESTGFFGITPVPVMTEKAFRSLLDKEHKLPQLWNLANARPDLSEASSRFVDGTLTVELGGYEFVIPVLAR